MNMVCGQEPRGFAIHIVNSFSSWVWHGRVIWSRSECNLRQTPVLQAVLPDVRQLVYRPAEKNGIPRFGPHEVKIRDSSPKSTASCLVRFILKIRGALSENRSPPAASSSFPPGNSSRGKKNKLVSSDLYTNSSFSPEFPARKIPGLSDFA